MSYKPTYPGAPADISGLTAEEQVHVLEQDIAFIKQQFDHHLKSVYLRLSKLEHAAVLDRLPEGTDVEAWVQEQMSS